VFVFNLIAREALCAGDVGYLSANVKTVSDVQVGDTITDASCPCDTPRAGFRRVKPVVFSSVYPVDTDECEQLREALERLALNDASISWERDSSLALGHGFRCGFLGLLHLEVVQQRLEREFNQTVIFTAPQVQYYVFLKTGQRIVCDNPAHYPLEQEIAQVHEPYIRATIITPTEVLGAVMTLCIEKRAYQTAVNYLDQKRVELVYEMPLAEILFGFYDRLKSISHGYASFDYELIESKLTDLVKVDILINGKPVDALAQLCYRPHARRRAQAVCARLKEEISRQQFKIAIQGSIGGQIISRETVSPFRKDVLAKCYGGDITRKRKLLEKQKEGKKRMKMVGDVEIPQTAFLSVLKEASDA
ncbi:translation elongation factor 4, partial [Treponema pallidum]